MVLLKSDAKRLQPGDSALDFSLINVDGKTISLTDFNGKVAVIIFMSGPIHILDIIQKSAQL